MAPTWHQAAGQTKHLPRVDRVPGSRWLGNLDTEHTAYLASCTICQQHLRSLQAPNHKPDHFVWALGWGQAPLWRPVPRVKLQRDGCKHVQTLTTQWTEWVKQSQSQQLRKGPREAKNREGAPLPHGGTPVPTAAEGGSVSLGRLFSLLGLSFCLCLKPCSLKCI